jgi:hypothetical protein
MTAPAIPLVQQIEEVKFAVVRQRSLMTGAKIRELRKPAIAEHGLQKLETAVRTLETLAVNADEIRAFLKLPAEARHAVLRGPKAIDDCWRELSEMDDRTSPADHPEMCLITLHELAAFMAMAAVGGSVR